MTAPRSGLTATPTVTSSKPLTLLRNGIAELSIKPGQPIPTERVAKAVHITPALAQDWLDRYADPDRRNIRPARINAYAAKMTAGTWVEMAKNIEFTLNGASRLSDGHHRLKAIVTSGVSLWFEVHFAADPRSRHIEGVRLARSPGDMLKMEGCPAYCMEIAAGAKNVILYEATAGTDTRWRKGGVTLPDAEYVVLHWLDEPALYALAASEAKAAAGSWPRDTAQAVMTAFTYLAEQAHPGMGVPFLNDAANGRGPTDGRGKTVLGILIQMLRSGVGGPSHSGTQLEWNRFTLAVMVRAFNAHVAGKKSFQRPEWGTKPFTLDKIR